MMLQIPMYWTVHLEGGPRRVNHAAAVVGEKIYSFGGYCSGDDYKNFRPIDVHVLNTVSLRWRRLPLSSPENTPFMRYGHTTVSYGDKIYLWGGRNDVAVCNVLHCFDTETLQWSSPVTSGAIPYGLDGHSACVVNNCMYIFGGYEEASRRFTQEVYALDFRTMKWTYIRTEGEPPAYRDFHSATSIGERMYIYGGRSDQNGSFSTRSDIYYSNIMYLDTQTRRWHKPRTSGDVPLGRRSHSAFVYNGHIYVFGGYNSVYNMHFNDLHQFNPATNVWLHVEARGTPPVERRRQSCLVVGNKAFLFGGTSPNFPYYQYFTGEDNVFIHARLFDHNDMHVLDFQPSLRTLSMLTVIRTGQDQTCLPEDIKCDIRAMTMNNSITSIQRGLFQLTLENLDEVHIMDALF